MPCRIRPLVVEIRPTASLRRVGATREAHLESYAIEPVPYGAIVPSPLRPTSRSQTLSVAPCAAFSAALPATEPMLALLIPDPVVRVFILPFETFPRRADEASAAASMAPEEKRSV